MHIDWATLAAVAIVAAGAALTVVMLVAFALVGLSLHSEEHVDRPSGWGSGTRTGVGGVVAGCCLLAAGLIVGYGLYLIIA
jgi:hypothetical protein